MSGLPWSKFFWSDYAADPALKLCSFAAQGLWMRMLCIAAEHDPVGYVAVNGRGLDASGVARMTGGATDEVAGLVSELEGNGVFNRDRRGWIYSRRMIKEMRRTRAASATGKLGGNPKLTHGYNKPGFLYLAGPRRDGAFKIGISINPEARVRKIRDKFRGQDIRLIEAWSCEDMGAIEAEILARFEGKRDGEWVFASPLDLAKIREKLQSLKEQSELPLLGQGKVQKPEARDTVDKSTAAEAASDPVKIIFDLGVAMLTDQGLTEGRARSLIGKWREGGQRDSDVAAGLIDAKNRAISNLVEWMPKRLNARGGNGFGAQHGSTIVDQVLAEKEREERRMQQHTTSAGGPC